MPTPGRLPLLRRLELASHAVDRLTAEALEETGLPPLDAHAVMVIAERGRMPLAEVRRGLAREGSTMTSLLDRLNARGYIARVPSTDDRRALHVEITEVGRDAADAIRQRLVELESRLRDALGVEAYERAIRDLAALAAAATPARNAPPNAPPSPPPSDR